ncbi:hypothetical protein Q5H92_19265 [Hymenobacter sp. M29]|uniref:Histone H1 n=1 Tax=Hymenobacter mellowenesis TaxID=3063995 RepID=A0ABT9AF96_9BACT|nr:hypothetical protein [Hymenobacter sp. M29]MDO7848515.1 hypothetical protein [Hymenobacter sp. M29]
MPPRKVRSDIKIGTLEKRLGLDKGAIRNPDGTDARSDKRLGKLRAEYQSMYGAPVRKNSAIIAAALSPKKTSSIKTNSPAKPAAKKATPAAPKAKASASKAKPKAPKKATAAKSTATKVVPKKSRKA